MADKVGITYLSVPVKAGIVEGICSANIDLTVTVMDFVEGLTEVTVSGVGAVAGTSTVSGVGASIFSSVGSISGSSTCTGVSGEFYGVSSSEHTSPRCLKVNFSFPMRNNADLRDPSNYTITSTDPITVTAVKLPSAQSQPFVGPTADGGKPTYVFLILDTDPHEAEATAVTVSSVVSYYSGSSLALDNASISPRETY